MALEDWTPALKSNLQAVAGIGEVRNYDEFPADVLVTKTLLIMPRGGGGAYGAGGPNITHYRVDLALYHPGQILAEAYAILVPFIKRVRDAIWADVTLGGRVVHCQTAAPPEQWFDGPGQLKYGDRNYVGILFRLDVKEFENVIVG